MKTGVRLILVMAAVTFAALLNLGAAQNRSLQQTSAVEATNQSNQVDIPMMQHMQEMDSMAKSVTSMADMCRMMIEKEMRTAPLKVAAIIGVGSLYVIALILFVVLEIQWIRFWSVRIKTERTKLIGPKSP